MKKQFTFDQLDSELSKINPRGSIIQNNSFSKIDEYIHTGNYILNAQLTGSLFGGIPNSRSVTLAGESSTGKTFLSLNICREAQKMGYHIIYCDSEAAVDAEIMENFGLDISKVRYEPVTSALEVRYFVSNLCEKLKESKSKGLELPKIMLVLDSLGNLGTTKERNDAISGSDKKDMTKQQELRSLFRVITMDLAELKIPFVITNHVYASVGSFIPTNTISGGGGAIYNSSIILSLSKAQLKEDGSNKTGIIVTSKPLKNRFARPIPIKFHISFYKGMNPYVGLEEFVSWKNCGIQRGKIISEKEFLKLATDKQKELENTRFENNDGIWYFEPKETSRTIAVRHLCENISPKELFTARVFTPQVLRELDENIIKKTFMLPKISEIEDIFEDILEDSTEE